MKQAWNDVYNPELDVATVIEQYFHPEYTQCINGVSMDRANYTQHVIEQRKNMTIDTIIANT